MLNKQLFLFCFLLGPLVGCQQDVDIRQYDIPLPEGRTRLLAAIFAQEDKTWFFKLVGPEPKVLEQKDNFNKFVRSVRFTKEKGQPPLTWTVPENWRHEPGKDLRYATFRLGPKGQELELTVIPLEGEAGSLLDNINRWRRQIGLDGIGGAELGQISERVPVGDTLALLVDMTSTVNLPAARKMQDPKIQDPILARPAQEFTYKAPEQWKKMPVTGERKAAFRVGDEDNFAEVTVFALGGSVLANINRWREQVGLVKLDLEQMEKEVVLLEVGDKRAVLVDLLEPGGGPHRKHILGAILRTGQQSWFFKMTGSTSIVAPQKDNFQAFVRSVKFN